MKKGRLIYIEMQNDINIFLPENIVNTSEYSHCAIASYCVLKVLTTTTNINRHCVSPAQIGFYLTNDIKQSRRFVTYIKNGLDELVENEIIKKIDNFQKNYILDCSQLWIDTEKNKFTIITYKELCKIFQIENVNNFLVLRYFIYLIGTVSSSIDVWIDACQHKKRVVGNLTIDYLAKLSGISERCIIEYNKILENAGILYIYRQKDFLINQESGEIITLSNVYGRPKDKIYIDSFAQSQKKHKESYRLVDTNIKKANTKRRLAQMYIQLSNGNGEKYSEDDILEIYKYITFENKKYENMHKKNSDKLYLEKLRDISIFDQYKFVQNEEGVTI